MAITKDVRHLRQVPDNLRVRVRALRPQVQKKKVFKESLVEPGTLEPWLTLLPRNSPLSCRSVDDFESQLGGFPLEVPNLDLPVLSLIECGSSVYVFYPVAQYAIDQAG